MIAAAGRQVWYMVCLRQVRSRYVLDLLNAYVVKRWTPAVCKLLSDGLVELCYAVPEGHKGKVVVLVPSRLQ